MKKVTVITLHNVRNYGSVLQALATQHVVQELGGGLQKRVSDCGQLLRMSLKPWKVHLDKWLKLIII